LNEDTSHEVHIAIFKIKDLRNGKIRFKVTMTAEQFNLTGCILLLEDINIIIVEGGPKGIKFYTRLVCERIKWNENIDNNNNNTNNTNNTNDNNNNSEDNYCVQVWQGIVAKRSFQAFLFKKCENESELKKFLSLRKCYHYYDIAKNYKNTESINI